MRWVLPSFVVAAACQTAAPPRAVEVTLRGDGDGVVLSRSADGCRADDVAIRVADGEAHGGDWHLVPGPAARVLSRGPDLIARIADDPGPPLRRAYLDPVGVPLARVTVEDARVAVVGPDRAALGTLTRDARGLTWTDAAGTATVTGSDDLELAAALVAPPSVPIAGRAVVACARLVAITPTATTSSQANPP